jgi:glycosyltransferase involved in cell wall biosynthesis
LKASRKRILFIYLGRRGALSQFAAEIARERSDQAVLLVSRQNELFEEIAATSVPVVGVDTFETNWGALFAWSRMSEARRQIASVIREYDIERTVVLMSHIWTPLLRSVAKQAGSRYFVIVHDAVPHLGDRTSLVHPWLLRDVRQADKVLVLSQHVANQLAAKAGFPAERIHVLFHPALSPLGPAQAAEERRIPAFLFFGRILAYKGLPLFVEACDMLRREGLSFKVGIAGKGDFGTIAPALQGIPTEIINRWVRHQDIPSIMNRYDAVVVPSVQASQSGVVGLAHGHGLPAIVTPTGGLIEQVEHEKTGLIATSVSAGAIADQMRRYLSDPALRLQLAEGVRSHTPSISIGRFVDAIAELD